MWNIQSNRTTVELKGKELGREDIKGRQDGQVLKRILKVFICAKRMHWFGIRSPGNGG